MEEAGEEEIRVLISTDILSEGLNLQDATRLINYDLHWNPVRLMQRIGRVDRRQNPETEERILKDHPDQKEIRGTVAYWNFLPPLTELEPLLRLYTRVSQKVLRISKTFGIEGRKLLTPEDDYDALREFNEIHEGVVLIHYDLHWNPVRLMQRIGRVDRRQNPETEERILKDHPDQKEIRGTVAYWNFLPPLTELEPLLRLYTRVSQKVLRISKTFGIEGRKLLTPEDDYDALREFNEIHEGSTTPVQKMHLEYQQLLIDNPGLEVKLNALPGRVFSGKRHINGGAQAVFFCYALPRADLSLVEDGGEPQWTEEAGECKWYLYDLATEKILDEPTEIVELIRCTAETPRHCEVEQATLAKVRKKVERHIKNTYLKQHQAPVGVKPILKAWMEIS